MLSSSPLSFLECSYTQGGPHNNMMSLLHTMYTMPSNNLIKDTYERGHI